MEKGVIQSPRELSWHEKKYIFGFAKFHRSSVVLSATNIMGSTVYSYLCRSCEKIVIDYNYQKCDANKK